jgi:hypothetical protein
VKNENSSLCPAMPCHAMPWPARPSMFLQKKKNPRRFHRSVGEENLRITTTITRMTLLLRISLTFVFQLSFHLFHVLQYVQSSIYKVVLLREQTLIHSSPRERW